MAERSSNFLIHASIQTQGACAETSLPQGGCPGLLCWGDLIRLQAGLTRLQAVKTSQAVPVVSHTWLEPANVTAVAQPCASDGSKSGGASVEYQKQFWYHFAI